MALAGVASASTVITFGGLGTEYSFVTDAYTIHNASSGYSETLNDGNTFTLDNTGGNFWGTSADGSIKGTWTNAEALTDINTTLNVSYTAEDFSENSKMYYTASGNGGSDSSLTLNFTDASIGKTITLYAMVTTHVNSLGSFTAFGLNNQSITYAANNGSGFSNSATFSQGEKQITMVKITGAITDADLVLTLGGGNKSGFQSVAYQIVPEPTTATLSLLALAGLAARRRRR